MPSVVIKPDRGRDEYVVWSTVTESPHAYGNRAEMLELLRNGIRGSDEDRADPEGPVRRAHHFGSSAMGGWTVGHWEDDCFIYRQAGILRRPDLHRAAVLQCEGRERDILDLLDPLEDDDDARRHLARLRDRARNGPLTPAGRIAQAEVATARAALGAIKAEVESWNRK